MFVNVMNKFYAHKKEDKEREGIEEDERFSTHSAAFAALSVDIEDSSLLEDDM